ncbi:MAG: hypothetical protein WD738_14340 [Pirellulales bacterium]
MDHVEAKWLLLRELVKYRRYRYEVLCTMIGDSQDFEVIAASGTSYQLEIDVFWDDKPAGAIRILASIDDGGWRAFCPLAYGDLKMPPTA